MSDSVSAGAGFGASSRSGGMRTAWPASSRSLGCARLPFTRNSPLRMMRWMWLNDRPGKPRLEEAVDPHAGFVRRDRDGLHAGRDRGHRRRRNGARRADGWRSGRRGRSPRGGRGSVR